MDLETVELREKIGRIKHGLRWTCWWVYRVNVNILRCRKQKCGVEKLGQWMGIVWCGATEQSASKVNICLCKIDKKWDFGVIFILNNTKAEKIAVITQDLLDSETWVIIYLKRTKEKRSNETDIALCLCICCLEFCASFYTWWNSSLA